RWNPLRNRPGRATQPCAAVKFRSLVRRATPCCATPGKPRSERIKPRAPRGSPRAPGGMRHVTIARSMLSSAALAALAVAVAAGLARAEPTPKPSALDEPVLKLGDRTVRRSELRDELGFEPAELVSKMREDDNFARIYAIRWYQAELFARAAADDGVAARVPGLQGAAQNLGRNLIADQYMTEVLQVEYKPTDAEIQSYYTMNKERCATPGRLHLARLGVQVAKNASE